MNIDRRKRMLEFMTEVRAVRHYEEIYGLRAYEPQNLKHFMMFRRCVLKMCALIVDATDPNRITVDRDGTVNIRAGYSTEPQVYQATTSPEEMRRERAHRREKLLNLAVSEKHRYDKHWVEMALNNPELTAMDFRKAWVHACLVMVDAGGVTEY